MVALGDIDVFEHPDCLWKLMSSNILVAFGNIVALKNIGAFGNIDVSRHTVALGMSFNIWLPSNYLRTPVLPLDLSTRI